MADERLAEATDDERRDLDYISAGVAAAETSSTGVAFVDMPSSVLDHKYADDEEDQQDEEENNDQLPYPGYVEKAFFYFLQTTRPRNWCLQLITWPYPFRAYLLSGLLLFCVLQTV